MQKKGATTTRLAEILPGALTWTVLTSPFWLSLHLPQLVAYLLLLLDVYWFYRAFRASYLVFIGYRLMQSALKKDYCSELKQFPESKKIYHLISIPTHNDELYVLEPTFAALARSDFPKERIFIALGLEERSRKKGLANAKALQEKFDGVFGAIFVTVHKLKPNEVPGPGGNRTFSIREVSAQLLKRGIAPAQVLLTTLDCDFRVHEKFLSAATYTYLTTPEREKRSFTGVFFYNNNYWEAPAFSRVLAFGNAFWQLSEMVGSDKYINFASMTINLRSLVEVGFWDVDVVNDDSRFFWKAYYHFRGDYKVIPHFIPLFADVVQGKNRLHTASLLYHQQKRWAYGVEHIPFILRSFFKRSGVPLLNKTSKVLFILWAYLSWATIPLIIASGPLLIGLSSPRFSYTALFSNLPVLSSWILSLALLALLPTAYFQEKIAPRRPTHWLFRERLFSYLQWLLVPPITLFFGAFPAVDAQTSLALGRYLVFRTTDKIHSLPETQPVRP